MTNFFTIREESIPFRVPVKLEKTLKAYPLETGSGGYAGFEDLPASFVWSILEEGNTSIGQVWINEQNSPNGEKRPFINFAVYAEWRSKGAARATLPLVENELRKKASGQSLPRSTVIR